jgi:hypothetical protein
VDQGVQLNRILRLLEEEEMSLFRRSRLYDNDSKTRRQLKPFTSSQYDLFTQALESSDSALRRNKLFEV